MERVAEYYYVTGDAKAKALLDKWVAWALANTTLNPDGTFQIPSTLQWTGSPATWNASQPGANTGLHVTVADYTNDVGVAAAYAKTADLLRRQVRQRRRGQDGGEGAARRHLGPPPGRVARGPGDPRRLQPLRRPRCTSRPAGPARCRTATRSTRRRPSLDPVLLQERPGLAEGPGLPEGRRRARLHLPPVLGPGGHRHGHGLVRGAPRIAPAGRSAYTRPGRPSEPARSPRVHPSRASTRHTLSRKSGPRRCP